MDSKTLVKLDKMHMVPPLLVRNWGRNHGYDPIVAARVVLTLERFRQLLVHSLTAGIFVIAMILLSVILVNVEWLGKPAPDPDIVALLFLGAAAIWVFAHITVRGLCSGLGALMEEFHSQVCAFDRCFSALELAHGLDKPLGDLVKMDLKMLAEELLVASAKKVLLVERELKEDPRNSGLLYEKFNHNNAFESLYGTLKEFDLVAGGYERFYTQAQKLREQERQDIVRKKEFAASVIANAGVSSPAL